MSTYESANEIIEKIAQLTTYESAAAIIEKIGQVGDCNTLAALIIGNVAMEHQQKLDLCTERFINSNDPNAKAGLEYHKAGIEVLCEVLNRLATARGEIK